MALVQFTYYAGVHDSRVLVNTYETEVADKAALEVELGIERDELKIARDYNEVEVSCADLDFCCTLK